MKPRTIVALAAATIAVSAIAAWLLLRADGTGIAPTSRPATRPPIDRAPDPPPAETPDARVFRSRDEAILLARRVSDGRPLARAAVALLDAGGAVVGRGDTDSRGCWRGPCPAEARSAAIAADAVSPLALPLPDPPAPASSGPPMLADRAVLRPGDALRVLVWLPAYRAPPPSGVMNVDGEPVPLSTAGTDPRPGWRLFAGRVPGDARPGTATVEIGHARLAIPVAPRWGAAAEAAPAAGPEVGAAGDAALAPADGGWRVALAPPADGHAVLVFASAGHRFLDHGVSIAEGPEAFVALPSEEAAAAVEVVAVIAAPDGFRVHRASAGEGATAIAFEPEEKPPVPIGRALRVVAGDRPVPMAAVVSTALPGGIEPILHHADSATSLLMPLDAFHHRDAVVRALALPPGRAPVEAAARVLAPDPAPEAPEWIYAGDAPAGGGPPPDAREFGVDVRVFVPAGVPTEFPTDLPIPPEFGLSWSTVAQEEGGAVRISAGPVVVVEASFGDQGGGGSFPARHVADGPFVATSDAAGFEGVSLEGSFPADPKSVRATDSPALALSSRLPAAAKAGSEFDAAVILRAPNPWNGPLEVRMPLPRGLLPAEDGWSIRARAPAGSRVEADDRWIRWDLPGLPAGETTLIVRLRAAFRGRWAAPPATAATEDPTGPLVRGAGGTLVIE